VVIDLGAALDRRQAVRVLPEQERAATLHVDEAARRVPGDDFGAPPNRDPEEAEAVAEPSADREFVRRFDDPEAEPGRRDPLQVAGVGEERKRLLERDGNDLRPLERVPRHDSAW
jgi:hypothetical protein